MGKLKMQVFYLNRFKPCHNHNTLLFAIYVTSDFIQSIRQLVTSFFLFYVYTIICNFFLHRAIEVKPMYIFVFSFNQSTFLCFYKHTLSFTFTHFLRETIKRF